MDAIVAERFKEKLNQQLDQLLNQARVSKSELAQENTQAIEYLDRASVQTH